MASSPKYQSIEGFGDSLLAKEDERIARARKDTRKVQGARVLLGLGNAALAERAERRATEVWNSGQEQLTQANDYLNTGLQFWEDHQKMLGDKFAPENWEEAYKSRYYENYLASKGLTRAEANTEEAIAQLDADLENDLAAYEKRMKLAEQFKLSGSETAEEKQTAFLSPIRTSLESRMANEQRNSTIIPAIMNAIGGRKGPSAEEQSAQDYFDSIFQQNATWDEATKQWETAQADNVMRQVLTGEQESVDVKEVYHNPSIEKARDMYIDAGKRLENDQISIKLQDGTEFKAADFTNQFPQEDKIKFWEQAALLASSSKYKYNEAGGYESEGLKDDLDFLQVAVDYLITEGRVTPIEGVVSSLPLTKNFVYNAYSDTEISDIVNNNLGLFDHPVFENDSPELRDNLNTPNDIISRTPIADAGPTAVLTEDTISLQDILADLTNNIVPNAEYAEIRKLTEGLVLQTPVEERSKSIEIANQIYKIMETDPEDRQLEPIEKRDLFAELNANKELEAWQLAQEQRLGLEPETNLLSKTNLDRIIEYDTTNKFKDLDRDVLRRLLQTMPENEVQDLLDRALNQERIAEQSRRLIGNVKRSVVDSWNKERNRGKTIRELRADDPDAYKQFQKLSNMPGISEEQALDIILSE